MSYFTQLHRLKTHQTTFKIKVCKLYPNYAIKSGVEGMFFNDLSSLFFHACQLEQTLSTINVVSNAYSAMSAMSVMPQLPNTDRGDLVPE